MKRDPYENDIIKDLELRLHVEKTRADSYQFVLRDQFAIAALQGLVASPEECLRDDGTEFETIKEVHDRLAVLAFSLADSMMERREKPCLP